MGRSTEYPPDRKDWTDRAAPILKVIPGARSPRISEIARGMPGNPRAGYRAFWPRWTRGGPCGGPTPGKPPRFWWR